MLVVPAFWPSFSVPKAVGHFPEPLVPIAIYHGALLLFSRTTGNRQCSELFSTVRGSQFSFSSLPRSPWNIKVSVWRVMATSESSAKRRRRQLDCNCQSPRKPAVFHCSLELSNDSRLDETPAETYSCRNLDRRAINLRPCHAKDAVLNLPRDRQASVVGPKSAVFCGVGSQLIDHQGNRAGDPFRRRLYAP